MKLIFKITNNSAVSGKEIIGDTNFKDHYPEVNRNMMWSELTPYIRQATQKFVIPFIGSALYDDISNKVDANVTLSDVQTQLVEYLRDAVAYYSIMHAFPKKKTVMASMGVVENAGSDGTTQTSQWGFKATLWSLTKDADGFMDQLLEFLEAQTDEYFDLWKDDPSFTEGKADFFRLTKEFQSCINIQKSRMTFIALLPYIRDVSEMAILPILGQAFYDDLVTKIQEGTGNVVENKVIKAIRQCTAKLAVAQAADFLALVIDSDGFKTVSSTDGMDLRSNAASVFYKESIQALKYKAEDTGRQLKADLIQLLMSSVEDIPLFEESELYKRQQDQVKFTPVLCPSDNIGGIFI